MISSSEDFRSYLISDAAALGLKRPKFALLYNEIWRFQFLLRLHEFTTNVGASIIFRLPVRIFFRRTSRRLGFTIPPNVFGPGLAIAHYGTIVVNPGALVGKNCRIHVCVNIGTAAGFKLAAPRIGDNCYIGPGAKLFGPIVLGDNMVVGANAVVNRSFPEGNATLAGVPAKVVSDRTSAGLLANHLS